MNNGFYEFSRGKQQVTSSVFPYTGSAIISGSLQVTGSVLSTQGFTGSLFGTSSWAINSLTASFVTGSNVFGPFGSNSVVSASFAVSSSRAISSSFATTASFAVSSSRAVTSSFAISASWAPSQAIDTSSFVTTSSFNAFTSSYNTGSFTGSFIGVFTGSLFGTASRAISASFAVSGGNQNLQQVTDQGNTIVNGIIISSSNLPSQSFKVTNPLASSAELNTEQLGISRNGVSSIYQNGALTLGDYNFNNNNPVNLSVVNDITNYGVGFLLNSSPILQDVSLIYHPDYFVSQSLYNAPVTFYIPYKPEGTVVSLATLDDIPNTGSFVTNTTFNSFTSSYNTGSFTGSFTGDGSGLTNLPGQSINTSSFATTGSNTFIGNQVITGSLTVTQGITGSLFGTASQAISSSYAQTAGNSSTIDVNVFGIDVDSYPLFSNVVGTTGVSIGGDADLRYNASTNKLTVGNVSATTLTGSLFGTASWANNTLTASFAQSGNGSFSGSFSGSGANLNSIPASAIVGLTTTQIATGSVTASVSPTQFSVTSGSSTELVVTGTGVTMGNALTDTHRVTGSLNITGSLTTRGTISGSIVYSSGDITAQNNLRSLNSAGDEGGEIFLNVPVTNTAITGGLTLDVYQNRFRIFEQGGTNRGGYYDITTLGAGASTNLLATSSAATTGLLSSTDWTTFNNKQNTATLIADSVEKAILRNNYFWFLPNTITSGQAASFGYSERIAGTFTLSGNGNLTRSMTAFNTSTTPGNITFLRRNDSLQLQGLEIVFTRKIQFNSNVSGQRFFCGISKGNQFSAPTNVDQTTLTDIVGVVQLSTSTNMHVIHNDASGTATTIDLGSSYPCNDSQYNYYITIEQTTTSYIVTVERVTISTGASISTANTLSTNIPVYNTGTIQLLTWITNNAQSSVASYLDGGAIGYLKNL